MIHTRTSCHLRKLTPFLYLSYCRGAHDSHVGTLHQAAPPRCVVPVRVNPATLTVPADGRHSCPWSWSGACLSTPTDACLSTRTDACLSTPTDAGLWIRSACPWTIHGRAAVRCTRRRRRRQRRCRRHDVCCGLDRPGETGVHPHGIWSPVGSVAARGSHPVDHCVEGALRSRRRLASRRHRD